MLIEICGKKSSERKAENEKLLTENCGKKNQTETSKIETCLQKITLKEIIHEKIMLKIKSNA